MAKLTKAEIRRHNRALELLAQPTLTEDDKDEIYENWMESATSVNSEVGAFFSPLGLCRDFSLEVPEFRDRPAKIIDLCAGSGGLARAVYHRHKIEPEITCVERNPVYVGLGQRLLPEARWITGDIFDLPDDLGHFDCAVANPPFGRIRMSAKPPSYTGGLFEFAVVDIASQLADYAVLILPSGSVPWRYSGAPFFEEIPNAKAERFTELTDIQLEPGIGIDTSIYADQWHGVSVQTEIVIVDFQDQD